MKNTHIVALSILSLLCMTNNSFGHVFTFSNHTGKRMRLRVKLVGIAEPWYYLGYNNNVDRKEKNEQYGVTFKKVQEFQDLTDPAINTWLPFTYKEDGGYKSPVDGLWYSSAKDYSLIPEQTANFIFQFGKGPMDYSRKAGFCLVPQMQYKTYNKKKKRWSAWWSMSPHFIESDAYNAIIDASSELAQGASDTASAILEKVAEGAATAEGGPAAGSAAGSIAETLPKVPISSIIKTIGTAIAYSLCKDRHFDIVEGDDGIEFITAAE